MPHRDRSAPTVADLGRALREGQVTAVELARRALEQADRVGRRHVAVCALSAERALAEATAADARIAAGDPEPLLGIPYGVKDIIAARGAPTSWGVVSLVDRVIDSDATVVDRLRLRGAAMVAKLVTTSLAGGGSVSRPGLSAQGQPHNPWAMERFAGGSSSGSAVAVALGIVPFALGSETGGSVIQPAAFCGVTGYRPTFGLIPRTGVMCLSPTLDKVGVLARTAEDCALVGAALAGPDGSDTYCRPVMIDIARPVERLTIGVAADEFETVAPTMREAGRRGLAELVELVGATKPTEISRELAYGPAIETIISVDAAVSLRELISADDTVLADPGQLVRLRAGAEIDETELLRAQGVREAAKAEFRRAFATVDVIAALSMSGPPQRRDEPRQPRGTAAVSDRLLAAANLAGLPGVAVPCGLDELGLPVSLHLVGPAGSDQTLLALASRFQQTTSYHRQQPPGDR